MRLRKLAGIVLSALLIGVLLVGCDNPEKMKDVPQEALPRLEPNPLRVLGGKVEGTVKGQFPPKYFNKKATLVVTPVYVYPGGELVQESKTYQGEDVAGNATVIPYENGGTYSLPVAFEYNNDNLREGWVELRIELQYKDKSVPFNAPIRVGVGTITTELLAELDGTVAYAPDNYQRSRIEAHEAKVEFAMQKSDVRRGELQREDVVALKKLLKDLKDDERRVLEGVSISAYASPDGPEELNDDLSKARGQSTTSMMERDLKKAKVEGEVTVEREEIDWEGLQNLVEQSDIEDKDMLLRVLSMYSDSETRNKEMHQLGRVFQDVATQILPRLRRSTMTARIRVEGKSEEELVAMAQRGLYDSLLLEEGLLVAANPECKDIAGKVYESLTKRYEDPRAWNNLAAFKLENGETEGVRELLDSALALDANNALAWNNRGVLALREGDIEAAGEAFSKASNAGAAARANSGLVALREGRYSAAVEGLQGSNSFNEALALVLSERYDAAKGVLRELDTPKARYLEAIVAARGGDVAGCAKGLRAAIEGDNAWKEYAVHDLEFLSLRGNEALSGLLK